MKNIYNKLRKTQYLYIFHVLLQSLTNGQGTREFTSYQITKEFLHAVDTILIRSSEAVMSTSQFHVPVRVPFNDGCIYASNHIIKKKLLPDI